MVDINQRIKIFAQLGDFLRKFRLGINNDHYLDQDFFSRLESAIVKSSHKNGWFTRESVERAIDAWAEQLTEENLRKWLDSYPQLKEAREPKRIAIIMAGNIPLVGFHDFLTVLISGNTVLAKMSSDDQELLPVLADCLIALAPDLKENIQLVPKIEKPDAVIATGSDNSARYFEAYFGKYPNVIRKNRTSVAVISGDETEDQLRALGDDLFTYFGMGCRNVSKIYVPKDFDLDRIFGAIVGFADVANNNKYANNYDYYRAIYMLNKEPFLENGFVLFREHESLHTPIAVIHYERYSDFKELDEQLKGLADDIQCVIGNREGQIAFGAAQQPNLWDYADGVDTVKFLEQL